MFNLAAQRSTDADSLIRHNIRRKEKRLFTDNPEGSPVRLATYPAQRDEADDIAAQIAAAVHSGRTITWDEALASKFQFCSNVDFTADSPAPVRADAETE